MKDHVVSIETVIDYIETHLDGKLDLEQVSEAVHYSKYHLHRMFTNTVGMTVHDYVQRRQLTEAAKLLVFSDKPIIEIAFICGYESQQSFSAAFKSMYKIPPAEYRDNGTFYPLQLRFTLHRNMGNRVFTKDDICFAEREDLPAWMNLMRLVIDGYPVMNETDYFNAITKCIDEKRALILKDGNVLIGAMAFSNQSGCIDFLGIHPQYRNKGIQKLFLDALLEERGDRLIIFVDELDRCKPIYAVRLLERIKHYFDNERITFVFSINTNELQHTIKRYYGENFDACRYLDRFFDLRMSLPPANIANFYRSISFNDSHYHYDRMCQEVINKHNFSIREVAKYIRITKIAAFNPTHNDTGEEFIFGEEKALKFCLICIVPIMIGLKLVDSNKYEKFIQGKDVSPLLDFADSETILRFQGLLEKDESFSTKNISAKHVTVADKLKIVYNALFNTNYDGITYEKRIGDYIFRKDTKETLLRTVGLFSKYTNFEID